MSQSRKVNNQAELRDIAGRLNNKHETKIKEEFTLQDSPAYARAFTTYLRRGFHALGSEERSLIYSAHRKPKTENRAQNSTIGTAGGYLVPTQFHENVAKKMVDYSAMRRARTRVLPTEQGGTMAIPTTGDTTEGTRIDENTQIDMTTQDVSVGQKNLYDWKYTSHGMKVPIELVQDAGVNLGDFLADVFAARIGRICNKEFTVGAGNSMPRGVVPSATVGVTAAGSSDVTYEEVADLEDALDPGYRDTAEFMFNSTTRKYLRKVTDTKDRPIMDERGYILDYPYVVNNNMPSIGSGNKSILLGAFDNYWIRDIGQMLVLRLQERYIDSGQIGFIGLSRHDGCLVIEEAIQAIEHP